MAITPVTLTGDPEATWIASSLLLQSLVLPLQLFSNLPLSPGSGHSTGPGPHGVLPGILTALLSVNHFHTAILS